jgi:superfamily II DNA or RNA helicase
VEKIRVTLSNRSAQFECEAHTADRLKEYFSFYPPGYQFAPAFRLWLEQRKRVLALGLPKDTRVAGWDGKIRLFKRNGLPAGLFRAVREEAERELGVKFFVTYTIPKQTADIKYLPILPDASEKYSYQTDCVLAMQKALRRGGGIVLSATGSGKTKTAATFFQSIPNVTCLFVVDTLDLLDQAQKEIQHWTGEAVGKVGESVFEPERITVATIQTLNKHSGKVKFVKWFKRLRIMIVDELHDQMGRRNFKILKLIQPLAVYGLTATLQLQKKDVRYKAFSFAGPVIFEFPLQEGVERNVLSAGRVAQFLFPPIKLVPEDYQEALRQQVIENTVKLDAAFLLVSKLIEKGRVVLVLVERIAHLKALDKLFQHVPHELAYGAISKDDRKLAIEKIESCEVPLIIANKVFTKGINIKRVDAAVDLAEQKSKNNAMQKYGRLVRLHPDKKELLYIDIGTQKTATDYGESFAKAATSRRRAFQKLGVPVASHKIKNGEEAVKFVCQIVNRPARKLRKASAV